jgi:hypothetical protein
MTNRLRAYRFNLFELNAIKGLYALYGRKLSLDRLPEVYLSDYRELKELGLAGNKEKDGDGFERDISRSDLANPDFLGMYVYNSNREGSVFLYRDRIDTSANYFSSLLQMKFSEVRDMIKYIVLMHELGHWLSHRICLENQNDIYPELSKNLKESMAQLHVPWSLQSFSNDYSIKVRKLFFEMVRLQPKPYTDFFFSDAENAHLMNEKSFRNRVILINRFIKISKRFVSNDFWFFLTGDKDCHGHFEISLKTGETLSLGFGGNILMFD